MKKHIGWEPFVFDFQQFEENHEIGKEFQDGYNENRKTEWMMNTPFGIVPMDDSMNPFKGFRFWLGHANFDITNKVSREIMACPGIEVYHALTRYRFMIAIGKAFLNEATGSWEEVRIELEKRVCGQHRYLSLIEQIKDKDVLKQVEDLRKEITQPNWGIYVFPNGKIDHYCAETPDEKFEKKLLLYAKAREKSGGILLTSNDVDEPNTK